MSDFNISTRKKQQRSTKTKSRNNKPKAPKRKSHLTKDYKENEREVQLLLDQMPLFFQDNGVAESFDIESQSVTFFCKEQATIDKYLKTVPKSEANLASEIYDIDSEDVEDEEEEHRENEEEYSYNSEEERIKEEIRWKKDGTKTSPQVLLTQAQQNTAFIDIDIDLDTLTKIGVRKKHIFEQILLYKPSVHLRSSMLRELVTSVGASIREVQPNVQHMLHRYHEEAKAIDIKLASEMVTALCMPSSTPLFVDTQRYRSYCDYKFHPIFCPPTLEAVEIPTRKIFRLFIGELRFYQHPHMLEEHHLVNELDDAYDCYEERLGTKLCEQLQSQLQTERKILGELLQSFSDKLKLKRDVDLYINMRNLEQQLQSIRTMRMRLYQEEATNKQLLQHILNKWQKLKQVRHEQQFQCTRFQLRLKVHESQDVLGERQRWLQRFEHDLQEWYREELELYYHSKRLWKQSTNTECKDQKPLKPNIQKLSLQLKEQLVACTYAPGEPKVEILRKQISNEEFYKASSVSTNHKQHHLKSLFLKIYFDGKYVGATRTYRLEPDLKLTINETLGIFVERRLPRNVNVLLYEKPRMTAPKKIADLTLSLPLLPELKRRSKLQKLNFSSNQQPFLSGQLSLRLQCDGEMLPNDMLEPLFPPQKVRISLDHSKLNPLQLNRLISFEEQDQNSEKTNRALLSACESPNLRPLSESKVLTCTFEEALLQFCSIEDIIDNKRFRLLNSRHMQNDSRTRDLRAVSSLESELEYDWAATENSLIDAGNWMNTIDLDKHHGKKHIRSLYESMRNYCSRHNKVMKNSENMLIGDESFSWSSFFHTIALLYNPSCPMNIRDNNANVRTPNLSSRTISLKKTQHFKIILNVVRATGIPLRSVHNLNMSNIQRDSLIGSKNFLSSSSKYSNVRPFIAFSYRDKLCRTMTAEGSNPTWNEQLVLRLSGNLNDLRYDLKISLFDEVIENYLNEETSMHGMDTYQRLQTNWLGEYRIPINSIIALQKCEGVLELNIPKVLLGYTRPLLNEFSNYVNTNIMMEPYLETSESVHLWYSLNIEPVFELPKVNTTCLDCSELMEVRQHLHKFQMHVKELKPHRFVEPLVCTVEGKRVCLTRLLESVPLPVEASENLLDISCRFVSLLSHIRNYDECQSIQGVWLDNQVILDTTWASIKDIGVLLCNYLLSIGVQCWLVLGVASPHGETSFVLYRKESDELMFLDPSFGKHYSVNDVFCPLVAINCVVSQYNIYYNIQSENRVSMTNFDFNDLSFWLPAFNKRNPAPTGGIQKLNYIYRPSSNTSDLRKNIEHKIIKKINTWRAMRKTIWNRAFQPHLLNLLQELEHITTVSGSSFDESKYTNQLLSAHPNHKIYGFTLNFSYTNLASVSDRIKSTGIHLNSENNVEYSLAVDLKAYPNNVISVWIFLISIIPPLKLTNE